VTQHPDDGILHALLDGEIRAAELPAIEAHLRSCATCVARLEDARSFRDEAERLVGEIELPAQELLSQATVVAAPRRPPRRLHLRPLAYAAMLLAALGLGYGARGWLGSSGGGATTPAADLAAAPVAPSESSLADMVSRTTNESPPVEGDAPAALRAARPRSTDDTTAGPRVLARQEKAGLAGEATTNRAPGGARDTAAPMRLGFAAGTATAPPPSVDRNRNTETRAGSGVRRFEGRVTNETGRGIGGAQIVIPGTRLQAQTGPDGGYRLEGEIPDSAQVRAMAIGYKPAAKAVATSDRDIVRVDFALPSDPYRLDEIVTTGVEARRGVSALRSPVILRTEPPAFRTIDFPEAVRRLGGRIRLLDGLIPSRLEALGDTVRVGYRVGRGQEVWLRQFRVGDTVAFALLPPPGFPADSLARLTARVTP
jgi:hypothetical protein